jgi:tripartite-type tricarboxylate transporter receptor subunit TctC
MIMHNLTKVLHVLTLACVALASNAFGETSASGTNRPLVVVVPWGNGGALDSIARSIAPSLEKQLKQKVMILNLAGDGSKEGHAAIQNAPADSNIIGLVTLDSALRSGTTPATSLQGLQPLVQLTSITPAIVLSTKSPFKSTRELIQFAQSNPGKLKASGSGDGGPWHLALLGLLKANGLSANAITWIPSNGAGPALNDLSVGALDLVVLPPSLANPIVQQGNAKVLSLLRTSRIASIPSVPTAAQDGSAPFEFVYWAGFVAPSSTSPAEVARLRGALLAAVADASFANTLRTGETFEADGADSSVFNARISASLQQLDSLTKMRQ